MQTVAPVQEVVTKGEHEALALANLLVTEGRQAAQARLDKFAVESKIVFWEKLAIAEMAKKMAAGQPWKRA